MPAPLVRPCVQSNKNDAADAKAICEAVQRPGMRPGMRSAALQDLDVQAILALHRFRRLLIKQRIQTLNVLPLTTTRISGGRSPALSLGS